MEIRELRLQAPDLGALAAFYGDRLGLPIVHNDHQLAITIGSSRLIFTQINQPEAPIYHFAFNIPPTQFAEAVAWARQRVALIPDETGADEFYSDDWDVHNIYFYDPAGNIAELIARHTLTYPTTTPFGSASLLNISEIGIATEHVAQLVEQLGGQYGLPLYQPGSSIFAPIGDEHGLLIVVKHGRIWFPNTGKPALHVPLSVDLVADGQEIRLDGLLG
jgi:catechol-2,3-dioxygenase